MKSVNFFVLLVILLTFGCSPENQAELDSSFEMKNTEDFQPSNFLNSMLLSNKIKSVKYLNADVYEIETLGSKVYTTTISRSETEIMIDINFEETTKRITFQNDSRIIILDLETGSIEEHDGLSGETHEIDSFLTIATTILFYSNENPKDDFFPEYLEEGDLTLWCFRKRKSECSDPLEVIEAYCGGEPAYVGGTDCGCVWGDFGCVCVTDFHCTQEN